MTAVPSPQVLPAPGAATARAAPRGRRPRLSLRYAFLAVAAVAWLIPIVWMLSMALTPNDVLQRERVGLVPQGVTFDNFRSVFTTGNMLRWFLNSAIVTTAATVLT